MGMMCIRHMYSNHYFENKIVTDENQCSNSANVKYHHIPLYTTVNTKPTTTPATFATTKNGAIPGDDIINNKEYFSKRNELMEYACKFARKIYGESLEYTHEKRVELQHR